MTYIDFSTASQHTRRPSTTQTNNLPPHNKHHCIYVIDNAVTNPYFHEIQIFTSSNDNDMRRTYTYAMISLAWFAAGTMQAQTVPQTGNNIVFTALSSEVFSIYVDGVPSGSVSYTNARQQVALSGLTTGPHDITIRLIRPTDRVTHIVVDCQQQPANYLVQYDAAANAFSILTSTQPIQPSASPDAVSPLPASPVVIPPAGTNLTHPGHIRHIATNEDVYGLVIRLKKTTFDEDKLQLAQSFVKGKHINTQQAITIAQTIRLEGKRLNFLLYAYDYCTDRENYYTAADVLTFNRNKQKLLKRIQTTNHRNRRPFRRR